MRKVYLVLLACTLFLIPANLFLKFFEQTAYVNGLLIDYLLPKLYASDLPILALLWAWVGELAWHKQKKTPEKKIQRVSLYFIITILLTLGFFFRQYAAEKSFAAIWFFLKLLEMGALATFLYYKRDVWQKNTVLPLVLAGTLLFQSIVGIWQFNTQKSFFPSYLWLGEVHLQQPLGLAKGNFNGVEKVLPYGTTAHPNILAGFLVIGILLLLAQLKTQKINIFTRSVFGITCLFAIVTLYLTQSYSAWLALLIGVLFIFWPKLTRFFASIKGLILLLCIFIISPFVIHFASQYFLKDTSFQRRNFLNAAALRMIIDRPFIGVGLNNFTAEVEKYSETREIVRFTQPAHNVPLLWLAETGLLGVSLLGSIFFSLWKKKILKVMVIPILILSPILVLDHYLLSQQTGLLLLVFFTLIFPTAYEEKTLRTR
jgi:O-antigen ligase